VLNRSRFVQWRGLVVLAVLFTVAGARGASAQAFIAPTAGYNFGGDSGCLTATNCEDKNWNFGVGLGALGNIFGFETEFIWEKEFTGSDPTQKTSVFTVMGNFMLAPKITVVQPYALFGIGLLRTSITPTLGAEESANNFGWDVGGGLIVYFSRHFGVKGDVRYFHAFDALELIGLEELERNNNKLDYGRLAFGAVIKF
jgi:opacity protein-like surface antigen